MSSISVVRIGPFPDDNDCAKRFRTALVEFFNRTPSNNSSVDNTSADERPHTHQISISNRYFTAQVIFAEFGVSSDVYSEDPSGTKTWSEDGIVLVFDALLSHPKYATSMTASFDVMETIHDQAIESGTAGDLLRLCVGIGNSRMVLNGSADQSVSDKEYEQEYSRRVLWCLDRGYEYVELLDLSEESISSGHDARDKEGFPRVVEAISGTVWTSAVMEQNKQKLLKESYKQTRNDVATSSSSDVCEKTLDDPNKDGTNTYEPPNPLNFHTNSPSSDESDQERERKARLALLAEGSEGSGEVGHGRSDNVVFNDDNIDAAATNTGHLRKETEEERTLNAFEASLREARRIRELAKTGQLSDEERRKRAADAAILIMDIMKGMSDEDDNDDDSSLEDGINPLNILL
jgi:hypothetical protein